MAGRASSDELRHAEKCLDLVRHFGGVVEAPKAPEVRPVAPSELETRERLLYEVVALSCVTETLSAALLGALVERARDSLTKSVLHSILRDEVVHSRLGWAFLAEEHARGARDCVSERLAPMLSSTLSDELFDGPTEVNDVDRALAGFGSLERMERQRVVRETLQAVVFPGLERFGIDTSRGRAWLFEKVP
ncbi:MAG TPA: ferritin-like domain-containing protein [Polyangiaceae bacterium]|nr:ferritin-like domain-containing protein [Polyangiaceae bacterium]